MAVGEEHTHAQTNLRERYGSEKTRTEIRPEAKVPQEEEIDSDHLNSYRDPSKGIGVTKGKLFAVVEQTTSRRTVECKLTHQS